MRDNQLLKATAFPFMLLTMFFVPAHAADSCQPLHDSVIKRLSMPSHMYMTETAGYRPGGPRSSEMIYVGEETYIYVSGKWRKSPITKEQMLEQQKENWANAKKTSCRVLRDEFVNGVSTTIYSVHSEDEDAIQDGQIWLSKSSGLPVKEELDMEVGGEALGKSHRSIRYEYTNVKSPM
jgi:hypothetical protein